MAKKFTVDVMTYPYTYEVKADTLSEAIAKAKELFYNEVSGRSVYDVEVTGEEDIKE